MRLKDCDPFAVFAQKSDRYAERLASRKSQTSEYESWEDLKSVWLSQGMNQQSLEILMKRGCRQLGGYDIIRNIH